MGLLKKAEVEKIIETMEQLYPEAECALHFGSLFQLLISVVLSAQTTDKSVNVATPALFARYPDAASMAGADPEVLEGMLKSIGMYKTKTRHIIALSKELMAEHGGQVPGDYDLLVTLPGVGRKTANVVLSVGFGQQRIAVDTHVFRLANRTGLTREKDVLATELALMKTIPENRWTMMHHSLIWHGRQVCSARNPKCSQCGIALWCRKNGL